MAEYVETVENFVSTYKNKGCTVYFRGESKDYGESALVPSIFRDGLYKKEDVFYKEIMRFNDKYFEQDKTTIDHLSRMQHMVCATRMLDLSEDCFTSLYFALEEDSCEAGCVYLFVISTEKIKYYDSDTVAVLANLVKLPFSEEDGEAPYGNKSKTRLVKNAEEIINSGLLPKEYNKKFFDYLLHHIKEDKPHAQDLICLGDIFSVQCVKTKLNTDRIRLQKGAFLLFGLNVHNPAKAIPLDGSYKKPGFWRDSFQWTGMPIEKILKIKIQKGLSLEVLEKFGISKPYIYPEMKEVNDYLRERYK
ncbi:MAG: FRG domain-containing protein [Bacteroidales bacterium]|nr:FRG domain-containing protein [Bacteroidales bacterium]